MRRRFALLQSGWQLGLRPMPPADSPRFAGDGEERRGDMACPDEEAFAFDDRAGLHKPRPGLLAEHRIPAKLGAASSCQLLNRPGSPILHRLERCPAQASQACFRADNNVGSVARLDDLREFAGLQAQRRPQPP